ncbi:hypothetical protein Acr_00g0038880 [Actinidia rufa]|uniref:Reverse transcriptase domain-containing protein n=1 Tax=Actinidia rufa TaxID=165716 RepID=A0A7J0DHS3_9ERIC|nr:hypothetical protein Acr_00g0038880 [Actinidia rufa]
MVIDGRSLAMMFDDGDEADNAVDTGVRQNAQEDSVNTKSEPSVAAGDRNKGNGSQAMKKSYVSLFARNRLPSTGSKLEFFNLEDGPVQIEKEEIQILDWPWESCLVGYFGGRFPEIDMAKKLVHSVDLLLLEGGVHGQMISYENLPKYCPLCKVVGHIKENCKSITKPTNKAAEPNIASSNQGPRGAAGQPSGIVAKGGVQPAIQKELVPKQLDPSKDSNASALAISSLTMEIIPINQEREEDHPLSNELTPLVLEQPPEFNPNSPHEPNRESIPKPNLELISKVQSLPIELNLLYGWKMVDNFNHHPNGRILMIWKEKLVALVILETSDQAIHCQATLGRRSLWENLRWFNSIHHHPWILLGDFNNVLSNGERINGMPVTTYEIREFKECCYDLGLSDLRSTGAFFTWTNNSVWCKLDRVMKLKTLKDPLKSLNKHHFSHISTRSATAEEELQQAQQQLHNNPNDSELQEAIPILRAKALKLAEAEMSFCSQIAKAKFLKNTDKATKFFHNMIKIKHTRNNIPSISLEDGSRSTSSKQHWGGQGPWPRWLLIPLYKQAWDIVGRDVTNVVLEFFSLVQILKQINHLAIALIPKTKDANKVEDFRPIACCNIVYKVISKIIATRLGPAISSIIDPTQAAFIQNESMVDNIFLMQELLRQYSRTRTSPRCTLNVDLRKAYDSID